MKGLGTKVAGERKKKASSLERHETGQRGKQKKRSAAERRKKRKGGDLFLLAFSGGTNAYCPVFKSKLLPNRRACSGLACSAADVALNRFPSFRAGIRTGEMNGEMNGK